MAVSRPANNTACPMKGRLVVFMKMTTDKLEPFTGAVQAFIVGRQFELDF